MHDQNENYESEMCNQSESFIDQFLLLNQHIHFTQPFRAYMNVKIYSDTASSFMMEYLKCTQIVRIEAQKPNFFRSEEF